MRPNMMVGALCLISVAACAACQPSQSLDAAVKDEPLKLEAQRPPANAAPKKAVAKRAATSPAVSKAVAPADAAPASATVMESRAVAANHQGENESIATTITGCLVLRDDGMFQLKDNDGAHAPKARSWKSGFIKKGSATVDVFDAGNRLKLASYANSRVSVSGTLTDRQLRARSMSATSEQCD